MDEHLSSLARWTPGSLHHDRRIIGGPNTKRFCGAGISVTGTIVLAEGLVTAVPGGPTKLPFCCLVYLGQ